MPPRQQRGEIGASNECLLHRMRKDAVFVATLGSGAEKYAFLIQPFRKMLAKTQCFVQSEQRRGQICMCL